MFSLGFWLYLLNWNIWRFFLRGGGFHFESKESRRGWILALQDSLLMGHTQILKLSLYDQTIFCKFVIWRQPPMEDDLKILNVEYLSNRLLDHTQLRLRWPKQIVQILKMKTTSHGRLPQNIKSGISQQPLIGSYSNLKLTKYK